MLGPFEVLKCSLTLAPKDAKPAGEQLAGPMFNWKCDEAAGTTLSNAAGLKFQGEFRGQPRWGPGHGTGSALELDGKTSFVECANSGHLEFSRGVAVSAWFKAALTNAPVAETLLAKGNAWQLQRPAKKHALEFALTGPSTTGTNKSAAPKITGKQVIDDGQWHHVLASYDGKRIVMYVDGVEEKGVAATGAMAPNSCPVTMGENETSRGHPFAGSVDAVQLYNRGLTDPEIKALLKGENLP